MRRFTRSLGWLAGALAILAAPVRADDWRQFRGGKALSVGAQSKISSDWTQAPEPAWRTPIEGSGWSQPIIVGDSLLLEPRRWPRNLESREAERLRMEHSDPVAQGHTGDLSLDKDQSSSSAVLWSGVKSGAGMPSPVVVGDYLYFFGNTATCPVVVGDRIVMFNESGNMIVVDDFGEIIDHGAVLMQGI